MEKTALFEARTRGYWNYRVPGILCTRRGTILVTAEARRGKGGDWDGNDVLLRRSLDGGTTWEAPRLVVGCEEYGPGPVSNFVMIDDASDGAVHALYCWNYARVFYMRSEDDGASFSEPVEITGSLLPFRERYPWRVIAGGPGHGIQLHDGSHRGRLLVPVWMSDGSSTEFGPGKLGHRPSEVATIYSDDHGATWQCGDFAARHNQKTRDGGTIVNPSETVAAELCDGRVLLNIRSEAQENRRLVCTSPNGAEAWSTPRFDEALLEPVCFGSMLKLRQSTAKKATILFANPDNLENDLIPPGGNLAHDRKRLTVKMSVDGGQTWSVSRVLEAGPSGYSDLAETPDGEILCVYECGVIDRMTDTRSLTVARFVLDWLMDKR
jgi:sialidase-1